MKMIKPLMIIAAFSLALIQCAHQAQEKAGITIGAVYNLTGAQSALDGPSAQGARAAVETINRQGGLLGQTVTLAVVDGETQPKIVAQKTTELLENNPSMPGIIGLSDTDMVLAAAPVAAKYKHVFLTSGATSPQLPQQIPDYLFLACFGDNVQAAVGAEWAYDSLAAREVLLLYNSKSTYTRLLQKYFRTRFEALGGRIVKVIPYSPDDMSTLAINPMQIDLVYLAATPDEVLDALTELRKAGISAPVLGGDGLDIGRDWQNGAEFKDVFFTTHAYLGSTAPSPAMAAFKKSFAEIYPTAKPDAFTALGYDAANLLMKAIEEAGTIQPEAVRKALAGMNGFQGVTGRISYRAGSRIPEKSVTIIGVTQGKQRAVGECTPAKIPAP